MKRRRIILLVGILPGLLGLAALAALQLQQEAFPHQKHERLFPVCQGCHAGVSSGIAEDVYPKAADCAQCHDGTRVKRIEWSAPAKRVSNLRFTHTDHFGQTALAGEVNDCRSCHAASGPATRMNVGGPNPTLCLQCHAHRSDSHFAATANCNECHVPLAAATALPQKRVSEFPRPPWHDTVGFVSTHGRVAAGDATRAATCAVCHARETCERCHANADRLMPVTALAGDPRVAALERGRKPEYPSPASHRNEAWRLTHGVSAQRESASCANCHTKPSCAGCHAGGTGKAQSIIAALPAPGRTATGVIRAANRNSVHPVDIAKRHANLAATGKTSCAACHSQQTCAACHAGSDSRAFHVANFVERHATDVFARSSDCQSCHSTERFCRDCHARTGIAAQGAMTAAFHTGQPMWFLSHGQAARTGMESCASCHRQNDCVRCHSAVGGWRINPHGPGFPAGRLAARNAASCRWCHASIPVGGS